MPSHGANLRHIESITDANGQNLLRVATKDNNGLMVKEAYQLFSGTPPTDNVAVIPTTGASFTYTTNTVTTLTSSIDPSITNLGYKSVYDNGHAALGKLVPTLLFGGFSVNSVVSIPDSQAQRMASYVETTTGRAPFVIKTQTRGRGNGGTIDYARDGQDALDILNAAVTAAGSNVFGYSATANTAPAIVIGYSTGGLDALNFACRFPDRCLGVVLYYPNYDNGYDAEDSYYMVAPSVRTTIAARIQPGGDLRLTAGAASLDQYLVRNPIDAIARIMAIPNGPHVWIIGDYNDNVALPSRERLRDTLQAIPAAKAKTHLCITSTGDVNRVLHDDGTNGASEIYSERYFFPYLLANATEWTFPQKTPAGDVRLLGWMKTKLFEAWIGTTTNPKSTAGAGGKDHAGEFQADNRTQRYRFKPLTSTSGYLQIIRDGVQRVAPFTATAETIIDFNIVRSITEVYDADPTKDLGFTKTWQANSGVTNSSGVTHWLEKIGGTLDFAEATNKPALSTDGNGKAFIQFTSASSHKLVLNSLIVDPTQDFTLAVTCKKTNTTTPQQFIGFSHHGTAARGGIYYTSGVNGGLIWNDAGAISIANQNGLGGEVLAQNNIHVIYLMRRSNILYMAMDAGMVSSSAITSDAFTLTGTVDTSLGALWGNGGGAYYQFFDGGIYEIDAKQSAMNGADIFAHFALMKSRWNF